MKSLKEEIKYYILNSTYSKQYKNAIKRSLNRFSNYLAEKMNTSIEEVHLEEIYETVSISGETLFYSRLDTKLVEQYFLDHLHKSYNWLEDSRRALQNFFLYLYRKYDFPILTEEMNFKVNEHKKKPPKKDKYVLTRHNLITFTQSLLGNSFNLGRDSVFFLLLITTGSRPSEILNTKVSDIDFINETIYRKQTKNKSSMFITLREGFGQILQRYVDKSCLKNDDYLINNNKEPLSLTQAQQIFEFFLDKAQLPFSTLHKLRHSFATMMVEGGADKTVIQQLLNHKDRNSTNTYTESNIIRNYGMELQANKEVYKHIRK